MEHLKTHLWAVTLAMTATVALTACSGADAARAPAPGTSPETTEATAQRAGESDPGAARGRPADAAAVPAAPATSAAAATPAVPATPAAGAPVGEPGRAFTTSDGLYTFVLPGSWSAVEETAPTLPGSPLSATAYSLRDQDGVTVAWFTGGFYGDGATGPAVQHTVLDAAPLPNVTTTDGGPVHYAFSGYEPGEGLPMQFTASIGAGEPPCDGTYPVALGQVPIGGNGYTIFRAELAPDRFTGVAEAAAWMDSAEYTDLRDTLTSLTFHGQG